MNASKVSRRTFLQMSALSAAGAALAACTAPAAPGAAGGEAAAPAASNQLNWWMWNTFAPAADPPTAATWGHPDTSARHDRFN